LALEGVDFDLVVKYESYEPSLYDLKRYFYNVEKMVNGKKEFAPVIGEDENCIIATLAFVLEKIPIVIQGYAGSGKTQIMEAVQNLIPEEKQILIKVGSGKFIWYQMKAINKKEYVIVSEYQKAAGDFLEVLKDWGERRDAQYTVTDVTKHDSDDDNADKVRVKNLPFKPFMTSKAYENKDAKITEELGRRVIQLFTNSSVPMNERILEWKLACKSKKKHELKTMGDSEIEMLKMHLEEVMELPELEVKNPAAPALLEYVPKIFRISCSLINYYLMMVDAVTKFNFKDRMVVDDKYLISTLEDNYLTWVIYGPTFIESCLDMNVLGSHILSVFPTNENQQRFEGIYEPTMEETLSETEVIEKLREKGIILKRGEVRQKLIELLLTGYVDQFEGTGSKTKTNRYYKTHLAEILLNDRAVDWLKINEVIKKEISEHFSEVSEEYIKRYCGDPVIVHHPISGQEISLLKEREITVVKREDVKGTIENIMKKIEVDDDGLNEESARSDA